ncbi:MAG: radical SAM protein [bacterium]
MRILLISPPFYRLMGFYNRYFPFGITLLGTILRDKGYNVKVYDSDISNDPLYIDYTLLPEKYGEYTHALNDPNNSVFKEVRDIISEFKPDLLGISFFTTFTASAFKTAAISKKINPGCRVVAGGPHAAVKYEEILKISPDTDFVIRGEAEIPLVELVENIKTGNEDFSGIKGLSYRIDGKIHHNPETPPVDDLDGFSFPDREILLNRSKYSPEDMGMIMTSRGCPYTCSYCISGRKVSYRSIPNVLEEIKAVRAGYGTRQFTFKDDSFTIDRKRVVEFCEALLRSNIKIKWECNTRVNLVDLNLLKLMKKAGCNIIKLGIETGSEEVMKTIHKNITAEQCMNAARMLKEAGIYWAGYFLIGLPDETKEDVIKTLDFMRMLNPDMALLGVYEPFPGTPLFYDAIKKGMIKNDMTLDDFYQTNPNDYYKAYPNTQTNLISPDEFKLLNTQLKRAFKKHNLKPGKLIKAVISKFRIYLLEPSCLINDMGKFIRYTFN